MNIYEILGIIYILTMVVAVVPMIIIVIHKINAGNIAKEMYMNLILAGLIMIISAMYFFIDYYSTITEHIGVVAIVRIVDAWLTISLQFIWFCTVRTIFFDDEKNLFWKCLLLIYLYVLVINLVCYGFFMDENYYICESELRKLSEFMEMVEGVIYVVIHLTIVYRIVVEERFVLNKKEMFHKVFCLIGTAVLIALSCQSAVSGCHFISGETILYNYNPYYLNLVPISLMLFGLNLMCYTFKCYSSCFSTRKSDFNSLNDFAIKNELTNRETQIIKMLYEGNTYQEIADELYISLNTVKRHINNSYRKLGVSSKMELIRLIRNSCNIGK